MQPAPWTLWFAKMKDSPKFIFINDKCPELVDNCIFSTGFMGLKASRDMFYYLWAYMSSFEFNSIKNTYSNGTTMQALNNDGFKKITIILPTPDILLRFADTVEPIFNVIYNNTIQNEKLSALRDTLLPKLMSGELDVSALDI